MISRLVKKTKNRLKSTWSSFADAIYANKKKSIASVLIALLVMVGLTFLALTMNTKIRAAQINNLVYEELSTKKIVPLSYRQQDAVINEKGAISVMFAKPSQSNTNQVLEIIDQKNNELNRNFYYYPIVYQENEIVDRYKIDLNEVTFIFFQDGTEKNRFTFSSIDEPEENFIPELNRLPMWNIEAQEN